MGAEGKRYFSEKGPKKMKKKPERGSKGGEDRVNEDRGKRKRLDAMTVGYFRRVGDRLGEEFTDEEERGEKDYEDGSLRFTISLSG